MEAFFLVKRHGAVEDGLAGDAVLANRGVERGVVGRVEHVAVAAGDGDEVDVGLEARGHGPHHVAHIEDIDILVNKDDVLELGE